MTSKRRTILITGAGGMLGVEVTDECARRGLSAIALDSRQLDITDRSSVSATMSNHRPGIVINCAAYTDVDGAEHDEVRADRINHRGARNLAEACAADGSVLVHISTDYIFGGREHAEPIPVDADPFPECAYARTKLDAERAIVESGCDSIIVRTSWLFAPHHHNFVLTILRLAAEREEIRVVDDQRGRPTYAPDLAGAILDLIERDARGVHHVANAGECTWFEFAQEIVRLSGSACRVLPCATEAFPRPAKRPAYSVLDLSKSDGLIGPLRHWRNALAEAIERSHHARGR